MTDDERMVSVAAARRIRMRHDDQWYGPMKDARCACELCEWLNKYLDLAGDCERFARRATGETA